MEVIAAVGPAGDYLTEDHTLAHMRSLWQPRYFDRRTWEDWEASGRATPPDRAHERVRSILDSHEPLPLADGVAAELDRIVDAFSARAGGALTAAGVRRATAGDASSTTSRQA